MSWSYDMQVLGFSVVEIDGSVDVYRSSDGVLMCTLSVSHHIGYAQVTFFVDLEQINQSLGEMILQKLKMMEVGSV